MHILCHVARFNKRFLWISMVCSLLNIKKEACATILHDLSQTEEVVSGSYTQTQKSAAVTTTADDIFFLVAKGILPEKPDTPLSGAQLEQLYKCTQCTLEPFLAGVLPQKICDAIRNLSQSKIRPLPFQNTLLFHGPPGTGKTTIAKEIAKRAGAEIHSYSGSNIITRWQGAGNENVQLMFQKLQNDLDQGKTVVLFVDEIDAVARDRMMGGGSHREHVDALNQFLVRISDYKDNPRVLIIFATNMVDLLDPALRSRSDEVKIGTPDEHMCEQLFTHYLKPYKHKLHELIPSFAARAAQAQLSCRDIENIIKNAYSTSQRVGSEFVLEIAVTDELAIKEKSRLQEQRHYQQLIEDALLQRKIAQQQSSALEQEEKNRQLQQIVLELQIQYYRQQLRKNKFVERVKNWVGKKSENQ